MSVFDEKASGWDTCERRERAGALADCIREQVPLGVSMRVIDIGAGTGLLGLDLAADVGSVTLTDPSAGMIAVAHQKIADEGIRNASAMVYDLPAKPPAGAPFDLATSLLALHHVEDTEATLRSIHAMLAPGGHIALVDLDAEDGSFHDAGQEGIHHHGFDRRELERQTLAAGFVDAESRLVFELERDGRMYPLFLLTAQRP